jgi:hypothetical protein
MERPAIVNQRRQPRPLLLVLTAANDDRNQKPPTMERHRRPCRHFAINSNKNGGLFAFLCKYM